MDIDFSQATRTLEDMINGLIERIPFFLAGIVAFVLFYALAKLLRSLIRRFALSRHKHRNVALVLGRLTQWFLVFVGLMVAMVVIFPTFTPAKLVEVLGIGGVAIGFAFRDILQNFLAGILILLTEPFQIGDQIVVGSYEGTVEEIMTRATYIKTYDGRRVVIPNADLFTDSVIVNTAYPYRRIEVDVGIGYSDDIEEAKRLIWQTLDTIDTVQTSPAPSIIVSALGDFAVLLKVRWWIDPPRRADALDTRDHVLSAIKRTLMGHGIDLPFPTQQILFHDQTETTDGDRTRQREGWPGGGKAVPEARTIAQSLRGLRVPVKPE